MFIRLSSKAHVRATKKVFQNALVLRPHQIIEHNQNNIRYLSDKTESSSAHDTVEIDDLVLNLPEVKAENILQIKNTDNAGVNFNNKNEDRINEPEVNLSTPPVEKISKDEEISNLDFLDELIQEGSKTRSDSKDEFEELLASLELDSEKSSKEYDLKNLVDITSKGIGMNQKHFQSNEFSGVDIDKNDENTVGIDFLNLPAQEQKNTNIVEQEKQLFQNIFNSYMQPFEEDSKKEKEILWNLKSSVNMSKNKIDKILDSKYERSKIKNISSSLKNELFMKTENALQPCLNYIGEIETKSALLEYLNARFQEWFKLVELSQTDKGIFETIYRNKLLKSTKNFDTKHSEFVEFIESSSSSNPGVPILNVFTLPILFNKALKLLTFNFKDGQLAITLFNILKKDIALYTVVCNQQTYNEILRIQWIYNGKSNLYGVEMIFIEMMNNGFNGDLITFNLVKQIVVDYYDLKMGKSPLNKNTGFPIWTAEDDKRVENIERKLSNLARALRSNRI